MGNGVVGVSTSNGRPASKREVDDLDRQIVRFLQRDGRATNTVIARELGVAETTVRKRIARLLSDGVLSVAAMPTRQTVNRMSSVILGISVDVQQLREVADKLVSYSEVSYVGLSTGRYDLIVEGFFATHEEVLDFVTNELALMQGVRDVECSLILKIEKFSYEWELP